MIILAPVDRSNKGKQVLQEAAALAEAFDAELHALHVLRRSDFVDLERTSVKETGKATDIDEVKRTATEIAKEAAADLDIEATFVGRMGDPTDVILKYAEDNDARYIVLGPRKRSPTGKAIFGSVSQSVLLDSTCPVVTTMVRE